MPATLPTEPSRAKIRGPVSPARVDANRRNAQLSTGPKTEEGKARSRRNAVKHGLTGAGIALPTEDAAPVEARFEAVGRIGVDSRENRCRFKRLFGLTPILPNSPTCSWSPLASAN